MSEADFKEAAERIKTKKDVSTDDQLELYGRYKQATIGDINIDQPWAVQVEARRKWEAWNAHKGKSQEQARKEYIEIVNKLMGA